MPAFRRVTGEVLRPGGGGWAGGIVRFKLKSSSYVPSAQFPSDTLAVTLDNEGLIRGRTGDQDEELGVLLWCTDEGLTSTAYQVKLPSGPTFDIHLAFGDGSPIDLWVLRASGNSRPAPSDLLYVTIQSLVNTHGEEEQQARDQGDADTLQAANAYTDERVADIDLSVFQQTSQRNQSNGYAGLDVSGLIPDNRIPASIARDSEVQGAVAAEAAVRLAGDAATLVSANTHADAGDNATLAAANSHSDSIVGDEQSAREQGDEELSTAVAAETVAREAAVAQLQSELDVKAPLDSPEFTSIPTAPTPDPSDNSTRLATTAFVHALAEMILGAPPEALNQLQELATALGNNPNFATTIMELLAGKAARASNLSDLADPASARLNLGLVIGADVQAHSARLATLAGLAFSNNDFIQYIGGTLANRTPAQAKAALALAPAVMCCVPALGVPASSTRYLAPGQVTYQTTEATAQVNIGSGRTIKNLRVRTNSGQGASGALTVTLRINGASTGVTKTIPAGTSGGGDFADLVNTFTTVATNSLLSVELVNGSTGNSAVVVSVFWEIE